MTVPMPKRSWTWLLLLLSGCQRIEPPPISPDTTLQVLREVYAYRAYLQAQNTPITQAESLLALYTAQQLQAYRIDTSRWESVARYYSRHPEAWQALLDSALYSLGGGNAP